MIELPCMIADFLIFLSLMVYAAFMMFLTFGIGFYILEFLNTHIIGV